MNRQLVSSASSVALAALSTLGAIVIAIGGLLSVIGATMPWAKAVLFGSIHISLPGIFFAYGAVSAASGLAAIVFRKSPVVSALLAAVLLFATSTASQAIPHSVRGELLGAQVSFAPLNQLLDQFHITTVTVSNYGDKDQMYLGDGIQTTTWGAMFILLGSLLSLPGNPGVQKTRRQLLKERCRFCSATWPIGRDALYCPTCGAATPKALEYCGNCLNHLHQGDQFCIKCGTVTVGNG